MVVLLHHWSHFVNEFRCFLTKLLFKMSQASEPAWCDMCVTEKLHMCLHVCVCVGAHVRRSALHSCTRFWSEAGYCLLWKYYCKCLLLLRCETVGVLCALHGLCGGIAVVVLVSGGWSWRRWGGSLLLLSPPHSVSHRPAPGLWPIAPWVMGRPIGVD